MDSRGFDEHTRRMPSARNKTERPRKRKPRNLTREEINERVRRFAQINNGGAKRAAKKQQVQPRTNIRSLRTRPKTLDKGTKELLKLFGNRGNMPRIRIRDDARFIIYVNQLRDIFSWQLVVSLLIVLVGGLGTLAIHAHVTSVENQIFHARSALQQAQIDVFTLESLLDERYTDFEIEWIATDRLGMNFPDPSQIIEIEVPRQGGITLNTIMHEPPPENYLAIELRHFLAGILNRIFGGGA